MSILPSTIAASCTQLSVIHTVVVGVGEGEGEGERVGEGEMVLV